MDPTQELKWTRKRTKLLGKQRIRQSPVTTQSCHSLFIHVKTQTPHWNNEWKTIVKPPLLTIKNDFYKNVIPSSRPRRNIKNHNRTYENNTQICSHQRTPTCERCKKTNNRTPHTTLRSIPIAKKATPQQIHSERQPKGKWNIVKPAIIFETHHALQQHMNHPSFCCR